MNVNKSLRILSASVMIAAALPALAERDRFVRNDVGRDRQVHSNPATRYAPAPAYRQHVVRRPVERRRTVVVERRIVHRVVPSRPVYIQRPVYVARRPVVYQRAPVYSNHYYRQYPATAYYGNHRSELGTLGGAIVGAVIGSQVANPAHRATGTIAGAVIGGVIGNGLSR
jgi:hypothetical protein